MTWGTVTAEFYDFAGTPLGTITKVVSARGANKRSRLGRCSVLLPRILTATEAGCIVNGGICRVYVDYSGTEKNVCTFSITHNETTRRGYNDYLEVSGYGQLHELSFRNADGIISQTFTGSVVSATANTIVFDSAVGSTDLTGWIANITVGASAPQGVIIESYVVGTKTATLKYNWNNGTPSGGNTYVVNGGAIATDDLDQYASNWLTPAGWTMEVEGAATGTADGSLMFLVGETALQGLVDLSDGSGEWFRVKSFDPTDRTIEWRVTADASGVTLSGDGNVDGRIFDLVEDKDYAIVTRVYPGGAGLASGQINLNGATHTLPAGFSYVTDPTYGIANTGFEGSPGDGVGYVSEYPNWSHIQPTSDSDEAIIAAKNQLAKQSVQYLQARAGERKIYRVKAALVTDLKPGQTVAIDYTAPGFNPYTISASGLYVQEVNYHIDSNSSVRMADLIITETLTPLPDSADQVANDFKRLQNVIKRSGAGGAGGWPGGGRGSVGALVALDANADTLLSLTNTTATLQTLGLDSQTQNTFFAAPNGSDGVPTFRAIVEADLPSLTPSFLTLATSTRLTNERVLTAGTGIGFVDTGADGTLTVSINESGFSTPGTLHVSSTNASGANHTHAITSSSDTSGGGASILASDSAGDFKARILDVSSRYEYGGVHVLSAPSSNLLIGNTNAVTTLTTGYTNVALGTEALDAITEGFGNIGIGNNTLMAITNQYRNTAIGYRAFLSLTDFEGVAIGYEAGLNMTTGYANTIIGSQAGQNFTTDGNIAIGFKAAFQATSAQYTTAIGQQALRSLLTGDGNTAIGDTALFSTTTGNRNTGIGQRAGYLFDTQSDNLAIGYQAGGESVDAQSVFIGSYAGYYSNFGDNVFIGYKAGQIAGQAAGTIYGSILIGSEAGYRIQKENQTFIGYRAGYASTTAADGLGIGAFALQNVISGRRNLGIGYSAGASQQTGTDNIYIGYRAGGQHTGSTSIFIGMQAGLDETTASNLLYIAPSETANPLIYGEFPNTLARLAAVTVEIGDGTNATTLRNRVSDLTLDVEGGQFYIDAVNSVFNGTAVDSKIETDSPSVITAVDGSISVSNQSLGAHFNAFVYTSNPTNYFPAVRLRAGRGDRTTTTASQADDNIGRFGAAGYDGTSFPTGSRGFIQVNAGSTWTGSNHETYLQFATTSNASTTPAVRMTVKDQVLVGGSTVDIKADGSVATVFQVSGGAGGVVADGAQAHLNLVTYHSTAANPSSVRLRRARGSLATPTAAQSGDLLGRIGGGGYGATAFAASSTAYIDFVATQNYTDSAMGTRIVFSTTADGSTSAAERLRITTAGISTNSGTNAWLLGGFTSAADAASNGYVSVVINGSIYKFNTRA